MTAMPGVWDLDLAAGVGVLGINGVYRVLNFRNNLQ